MTDLAFLGAIVAFFAVMVGVVTLGGRVASGGDGGLIDSSDLVSGKVEHDSLKSDIQ